MSQPQTLPDMAQIQTLLPHRYPFLLVDKVLSIDYEARKIVATKNVSINEPFFQGHFPNQPIMPGVLIIEAMAQAGGVLTQLTLGRDSQSKLFYMVKVDKARFTKQVVPGDVLEMHVEIKRVIRNMAVYDCVAKVDGHDVAAGRGGLRHEFAIDQHVVKRWRPGRHTSVDVTGGQRIEFDEGRLCADHETDARGLGFRHRQLGIGILRAGPGRQAVG